MSSIPSVSVIIPNYNHAEFLEQRIECVVNQSYSNFEVIVLDDKSTDESLEIINKYEEHPRISSIITNGKNSGSVFKQWVRGISNSGGKYLWIAESDDYANVDFLKEMVALAEKNPSAGLVFSDSNNVDAKDVAFGKISSRHPILNEIQNSFHLFPQCENASMYFISDMLILNVSSVLFNLEKLKLVTDFEELQTYKNCGDRFVYLSIFLNFDMVYLNKSLNYRRNHDKNITKSNFSSGLIFRERMGVINYYFKELKNLPEAKKAFNSYLKSNFLPVVDNRFNYEMVRLLRRFYLAGLISLKFFLYLSFFTIVSINTRNNTPYILRKKVKKVLKTS